MRRSEVFLGLRLAFRRTGAARVRSAAVVGVVAVAVFLLLCTASVSSILSARESRLAARSPSALGASTPRLLLVSTSDYLGGRLVTRVNIAGLGSGSLRPPGVSRLPGPGEAVVSPELRRLLAASGVAGAARYGRVVGTVGPAGLQGPEEVLAYVGWSATTLAREGGGQLRAVGQFGRSTAQANADFYGDAGGPAGEASKALFAVGGLLLVALTLALAISVRLSAASRDLGWAAMRLAGGSARQVRLLVGVETAAMSAIGVLLGAGAYLALRTVPGLRIAGIGWYRADVHPGAWGPLIIVGVPGLALVVAQAGARNAIASAFSVRRGVLVHLASGYRLVPLVLGLAGATFAAFPRSFPGHLRGAPLGTTALACGLLATLSLPLATPVIVRSLAGLVADRTTRQSTLLSGRRLQYDPSTATRVVVGIGLIIVVVGSLRSLTDEQRRTDADVAQGTQQPGRSLLRIDDASDANLATRLRATPGVRAVASLPTLSVRRAETVSLPGIPVEKGWVVDCRDALTILNHDPADCGGRSAMWIASPTPLDFCDPGCHVIAPPTPGEALSVESQGSAQVVGTLPSPIRTLRLALPPNLLAELQPPVLLISPKTRLLRASALPAATSLAVVTDGTPGTEQLVRNVTKTASPFATVTSGPSSTARRLEMSSVLRGTLSLGATTIVLVGLTAFAVTSLDALLERRRNAALLLAVGIRPGVLRRAQALYLVFPLAVVTVLTLGIAVLDQIAYSRVANRPTSIDWAFLMSLVVLVVAFGTVTIVTSTRVLKNAISAELLRTE